MGSLKEEAARSSTENNSLGAENEELKAKLAELESEKAKTTSTLAIPEPMAPLPECTPLVQPLEHLSDGLTSLQDPVDLLLKPEKLEALAPNEVSAPPEKNGAEKESKGKIEIRIKSKKAGEAPQVPEEAEKKKADDKAKPAAAEDVVKEPDAKKGSAKN